MDKLIPGGGFPAFDGHELQLFNGSTKFTVDGVDILYLPYVDFTCLKNSTTELLNITSYDDVIGLPADLLESEYVEAV